jgi:type I restriction enzyme S subunit
MGTPPGVAAVYPESMPTGVVTADVIRVRCDRTRCLPEYLAAAINGHWFRRQLTKITEGVTRPKLTLRDFRRVTLPLPPLPVQMKFHGLLQVTERLRATNVEAIKIADALFNSLAQRAFRGEV